MAGSGALAVSKIDISANAMVWDPVSQQIFLSVRSSGANDNTVTALDPSTGQFGVSVKTGNETDHLTVSSDGSYLYAGIDGAASVQRFTLPNLTPVNAGAVQRNQVYPSVFSIHLARLHYDDTTELAYSNAGQAVNPSTGAIVGSFPLSDFMAPGDSTLMVPDGILGYAYFVGQTQSQISTPDYTIEVFDLSGFTPVASAVLKNVSGTPVKLIRWGTDGLALLTKGPAPSTGNSIGQGGAIYLIRGPFVSHPAAQA